jgi:hypothetical protein
MTSLQTGVRQIPSRGGYYVNIGDVRTTFYQNNGTDSAPLMSSSVVAYTPLPSSYMRTAGCAVFRDHGKTLLSANRVFRKVQLLVSTGSVLTGGSDGVAGSDNLSVSANTTPNYLTGYIELPGLGNWNSGLGTASGAQTTPFFTPVARLG